MSRHWRPALTCDVVLFSRQQGQWMVLLIARKHPPFAGSWALPGGFLDEHEELEACARRELQEETGIGVERLEQLRTYGRPGRDPRGRTVSVAWWTTVDASRLEPAASDDAADARWWPVDAPPALAFDHAEILADATARLRAMNLPPTVP